MSFAGLIKYRRGKRKYFIIIPVFLFLIFAIYVSIPLANEQINRDYSQVILAEDSTFLRVFLNSQQQWCLPPQIQTEIPENLKTAVLTYEDQYFMSHLGVNLWSLIRAVYLNLKHKRIVSGGSTITMQLARMIQDNERTVFNKTREMLLAVKLEVRNSKHQILEDYLCHAPYGTNVRGYIAASYRFFGKKPHQLTWAEAATLAVLPNAPGIVFPTKNDQKLRIKRDKLLKKLHHKGIIDQETYELSLMETTPREIIPFPLAAPHLTDRIHARNQLATVYTTINPDIQRETNFFVKQHSARLQQRGIENACALVLDNSTGHIVSYVGSQDYHDLDAKGRVDGITSPRSSGSILKPFLYALAIDEGLILPQTLIKDIPTYFNSFSPSNASEKFSGIVPAAQALVHSLNVPAVRLLNAYGIQNFYHQLEAAGVKTLFRHADEYGLPLILGGAEVTPWDMARLYCGMANNGQFGEISYMKHRSPYKSQIISSWATFLIMDELKELLRPGLEFYWKKYSAQRPIAWKTGTSYGHKDAWAIGSTPKWTIVVWVGNFDGSSNKNLSGMQSAGPLLFNILHALPCQPGWFSENRQDYVYVKLCKQTGFYASDNCDEYVLSKAPKMMKPLKTCSYHKRFQYDEKNMHTVCSFCWDSNRVEKTVLKYPPDVNYYLRKNGNIVNREPNHNPACTKVQENDILQIIYPVQAANVFIPKDFDGLHQPLVSKVATQHPEREVFWYLDDTFLGSTVNKQTLPLTLDEGKHLLTVVDIMGNKDQVEFSVILN